MITIQIFQTFFFYYFNTKISKIKETNTVKFLINFRKYNPLKIIEIFLQILWEREITLMTQK